MTTDSEVTWATLRDVDPVATLVVLVSVWIGLPILLGMGWPEWSGVFTNFATQVLLVNVGVAWLVYKRQIDRGVPVI